MQAELNVLVRLADVLDRSTQFHVRAPRVLSGI
jgi:hypothetical protein